ncbi:MAG: HAD family hydrolase, partial [Nitrososphaera sp.]
TIFVNRHIEEELAMKVALETYHENYSAYEYLVKPCYDAILCIEFLLKMGFKVGIVSQTPREELDYQLKKCGLDKLIPYSVAQKETACEKPHPLPLLVCLWKLGVKPDEAIYVGDMREDILCARDGRVTSVALDDPKRSYHTSTRLLEARPDYIVSNLLQLIDLLTPQKVAVLS